MNQTILYIATSQDGFIADSEGGVDWLPHPNSPQDLETLGYNELMARIDTIVMGHRSYQQIVTFGEWAWPDKHTYVFTSKVLESSELTIEFTHETPKALMEKLKQRLGNKDIWILGGAQLAQSFAREKLIDEIILTIIPLRLEEGISLGLSLDAFYLSADKSCIDGIVQKTYLRKD